MTYACELENFSCEVLEDGGNVDGRLGADTHLVLRVLLQEALDTTAGELEGGRGISILGRGWRRREREQRSESVAIRSREIGSTVDAGARAGDEG